MGTLLSRSGLLAALLLPLAAAGQSVALAGHLGNSKALLVIDGRPQTLAVGESARGVTLTRLASGEAEVLVAGQRQLLRVGATPTQLGEAGAAGSATSAGNVIVLPAVEGGHFVTEARINGQRVNCLIDTGATSVSISQSTANRIGLDWKSGRPALSQTANGVIPVHQVVLSSVKIGAVEVANVRATVVPADMPMVLLGNSFLERFTMRRDSDVMRLEKKL